MYTHKMVRSFDIQAIEAQAYGDGQASAFSRCKDDLLKYLLSDANECKLILESCPEPSTAERNTWTQVTRDYVEVLESIVDQVIKPDVNSENMD